MGSNRRTFLKTATFGAVGVALGNSFTMGQRKRAVDKLYDGAIVIDSLSAGRQWGEVAYSTVKESGYTGIQTSLHNRTWDGARHGGFKISTRSATEREPSSGGLLW